MEKESEKVDKNESSEKEEQVNEKSPKTKRKAILSIISSLFTIVFVIAFSSYLTNLDSPNAYFSKSIQNNISKTINNGGDLATIKHLYNTRKIEKKAFWEIFFGTKKSIYTESTTLSEILSDLKVNYYLKSKQNPYYLKKLETIIEIHDQINPFDKLESNQRLSFENMRVKLDSNYVIIQEDLNRVVDELNNKNLLVTKYLDKSTTSFWISIIALGITVILSAIQIWQNSNKTVLKYNPVDDSKENN